MTLKSDLESVLTLLEYTSGYDAWEKLTSSRKFSKLLSAYDYADPCGYNEYIKKYMALARWKIDNDYKQYNHGVDENAETSR